MLRLRRPWSDGTRAIQFEPSELLEKLAAMIPRPRINLLVYHGLFAPHARGRGAAVRVAQERSRGDSGTLTTAEQTATAVPARQPSAPDGPCTAAERVAGEDAARTEVDLPASEAAGASAQSGDRRRTRCAWAALLRRTFAIDVLTCPGCGGRLRLLATIEHRAVVEKILRHLGLPTDVPRPAPPRSPPWLPGFAAPADALPEWPS